MEHSPVRYVRVFFKSTNRLGPVTLQVLPDSFPGFLRGIEVHPKTGEEVSRGIVQQTEHLIHEDAIKRTVEYRMSLKYAELEVVE